MIISPSRDFVFIHLEKCGGTSVETALQPHLAWYDMILGSTDFGEKLQLMYYERFGREEVNKYMLWKHSTAKDIHAFLGPEGWNDFKKISIVRNPEDLMKSLYFFSQTTLKYHVGRINRETWKDWIRVNSFPDSYPYTEKYFIAYVQSQLDGSGIDGFIDITLNNDYPFIRPQVERLAIDHRRDLDLVIDLSTLNSRWQEVLDAIGIEDNVELEKLNVSEREEVSISSRSAKLLHNHFAIDYEILPRYTGITW